MYKYHSLVFRLINNVMKNTSCTKIGHLLGQMWNKMAEEDCSRPSEKSIPAFMNNRKTVLTFHLNHARSLQHHEDLQTQQKRNLEDFWQPTHCEYCRIWRKLSQSHILMHLYQGCRRKLCRRGPILGSETSVKQFLVSTSYAPVKCDAILHGIKFNANHLWTLIRYLSLEIGYFFKLEINNYSHSSHK